MDNAGPCWLEMLMLTASCISECAPSLSAFVTDIIFCNGIVAAAFCLHVIRRDEHANEHGHCIQTCYIMAICAFGALQWPSVLCRLALQPVDLPVIGLRPAIHACAGTIGFYACYIFVQKIYSAVKID